MVKHNIVLSVKNRVLTSHYRIWHSIRNLAMAIKIVETLASLSASRSLYSYLTIHPYWQTTALSSHWILTASIILSFNSTPTITTISMLLIVTIQKYTCKMLLLSKINRVQLQICIKLVCIITIQTLLHLLVITLTMVTIDKIIMAHFFYISVS